MKQLRIKAVSGASKGAEFLILPDQSKVLGRSDSCDLTLPDDPLVSSHHAEIQSRPDGGFELTDLGSMNGTYFNNERISSTMKILDGDVLRFGRTEFISVLEPCSEDVIEAGGTITMDDDEPERVSRNKLKQTIPEIDIAIVATASSALCVGTSSALLSQFPKVEQLSELKEAVQPDETILDSVQRLSEEKRAKDALPLLAYGLNKRHSVWWASQAVRKLDSNLPEAAEAQLSLAEAWVREPDDARGRRAMEAAEQTEFDSAAAWACVAAHWSSDNIAPDDNPGKIQPAAELTGKAVMAAIQLAVAKIPEEIPERNHEVANLGVQVALGASTWES